MNYSVALPESIFLFEVERILIVVNIERFIETQRTL